MTVPQEVFANDTATGTLASDPTTGTTLTLTTGHGARFPTITSTVDQFRVRVESEIMIVTAHGASADTMTVTRGAEGTTNVAHAIALTPVDAVLTADALERSVADYLPQPRHWGFVAWTMVPDMWQSTGSVLTAGSVYVFRAFIPETVTFASMTTAIATVGIATVSWWMGVYNSAGTLLGKTADQGANVTSAAIRGPYALTVEGGQSLTVAGVPGSYVYLATLVTGAGTPYVPVVSAGNNSGRPNVNLTGATLMGGIAATAQASLPSSITPSGITLASRQGIAAS